MFLSLLLKAADSMAQSSRGENSVLLALVSTKNKDGGTGVIALFDGESASSSGITS